MVHEGSENPRQHYAGKRAGHLKHHVAQTEKESTCCAERGEQGGMASQDGAWGEVVQRMGRGHLEPHVARAKEEVPVARVCV